MIEIWASLVLAQIGSGYHLLVLTLRVLLSSKHLFNQRLNHPEPLYQYS